MRVIWRFSSECLLKPPECSTDGSASEPEKMIMRGCDELASIRTTTRRDEHSNSLIGSDTAFIRARP